MKKSLLLLLPLVFAFVFDLQAKVWTVSNRPGASAQYKTVPDAIEAAAAGDTIYIYGSETQYDNFELNKKLTFIGTGHNPEKDKVLISKIGNISIGTDKSHNSVANGSTFIGLQLHGIFVVHSFQHDIVIKRCNILSEIRASDHGSEGISKGWIIENNIIGIIRIARIDGQPDKSKTSDFNFIIRNNIIKGTLWNVNASVITNNVFLGASTAYCFSEVYYSIIQNNIFYESFLQGAHYSTFNNNITFSGNNPALPYGTNSGSLNKVNVDPKFTSYPGGQFSYDHDYHLKESSPGKNAGTDGTDIGIYGGMGFSETGEPPIPMVRSFSIQNGVIAPNGKLKIQFKAEAKN